MLRQSKGVELPSSVCERGGREEEEGEHGCMKDEGKESNQERGRERGGGREGERGGGEREGEGERGGG